MKLHRREFLFLPAVLSSARGAMAQGYPARPLHLIVGFAPGGTTDIIARLIGQALAERLGQPVVVENRPGGSTNLATQAVVRAPPDGYTLLLIGPPATINATLYDNLNFSFVRDIAPVGAIVRMPFVIVVEPSFPAKTLPELIAYAKANPGKVSMGTPGNATGPEMAGELLKMMAGIDMLTVRYRGDAPALADVLARHVDIYFSAQAAAIKLIAAGRLRALAVTTATRSELLPEIPTVAELLPGFEASWLSGIGVPKNTPSDVVERLNREINAGLADPAMKSRLAKLGGTPLPLSVADYGKLIADDIDKWAKVIHAAKLRPD